MLKNINDLDAFLKYVRVAMHYINECTNTKIFMLKFYQLHLTSLVFYLTESEALSSPYFIK